MTEQRIPDTGKTIAPCPEVVPDVLLGRACRELGIETVEQLKTRLAPDPRVAVWTPIASAKPQAGKHALLLCKNGRGKEYIIIGQWIPRFFEDNCDSDNAEYCEEKDEYYAPEGWYESIHNWDECTSVQVNDTVTHWMELAPLIAAQRGEGV